MASPQPCSTCSLLGWQPMYITAQLLATKMSVSNKKEVNCHLSATLLPVSAACEVPLLPICFHICFINVCAAFFPVLLPYNSQMFGYLNVSIWKHRWYQRMQEQPLAGTGHTPAVQEQYFPILKLAEAAQCMVRQVGCFQVHLAARQGKSDSHQKNKNFNWEWSCSSSLSWS